MFFVRDQNFRPYAAALGLTNISDGIVLMCLPWIASQITRDAFLVSLVTIALRLPWLLISIPAGVWADRVERKLLMLRANAFRCVVASAGAIFLLSLPALPLDGTDDARASFLVLILAALAFLFGAGEVVHDNTAQSALPLVVSKSDLEAANGLLWSIENLLGKFIGPPIAGVILVLDPSLPMVVVALMLLGAPLCLRRVRMIEAKPNREQQSLRSAFAEGFLWLWANSFFLRVALILAGLNFFAVMQMVILVLFVQDVLGLSAGAYGLILACGAMGGILGGIIAPRIIARIGSRAAVMVALVIISLAPLMVALTSSAIIVGLAEFLVVFGGLQWNIVTVSLRQRLIPAQILGRVNAVYRLFGWGVIAFGGVAAGVIVSGFEVELGRNAALRVPYGVAFLANLLLLAAAWNFLKFPKTQAAP